MIKIDLKPRRLKKRLSTVHLTLIYVGIFLVVTIAAASVVYMQWQSFTDMYSDIQEFEVYRDSLQLERIDMTRYNNLVDRYTAQADEISEGRTALDVRLKMLKGLRSELEPGMRFVSCRIEADSAVAYLLSPSNMKVARFVERLSEMEGFKVEKSEPQGTRQGLIEHRVLMRMQ